MAHNKTTKEIITEVVEKITEVLKITEVVEKITEVVIIERA